MPADPSGSCATVRQLHMQPLAIDGVFRATPRTKGARRFDWFRTDALAHVLPSLAACDRHHITPPLPIRWKACTVSAGIAW